MNKNCNKKLFLKLLYRRNKAKKIVEIVYLRKIKQDDNTQVISSYQNFIMWKFSVCVSVCVCVPVLFYFLGLCKINSHFTGKAMAVILRHISFNTVFSMLCLAIYFGTLFLLFI